MLYIVWNLSLIHILWMSRDFSWTASFIIAILFLFHISFCIVYVLYIKLILFSMLHTILLYYLFNVVEQTLQARLCCHRALLYTLILTLARTVYTIILKFAQQFFNYFIVFCYSILHISCVSYYQHMRLLCTYSY